MKKADSGWNRGRLMFASGRTLDFPSYYLVQGL